MPLPEPPVAGATLVPTDVGDLWLPGACQVVTPALRSEGEWERELGAVLAERVQPGMTAVDAGAHVGYVARMLSTLVGPEGRVFAIEPAPDNVSMLRANLADRPNATVVHAAAWASSGTLELALSTTNSGDHRTADPGDEGGRAHVRVPALALDEIFAEMEALDVVVLDVQGSEPYALGGMRWAIERFRPLIIVELWPEGLREAGHDPQQVLDLLTEAGYRLSLLETGGDDLLAAAEAHRGGYATLIAEPADGSRGTWSPGGDGAADAVPDGAAPAARRGGDESARAPLSRRVLLRLVGPRAGRRGRLLETAAPAGSRRRRVLKRIRGGAAPASAPAAPASAPAAPAAAPAGGRGVRPAPGPPNHVPYYVRHQRALEAALQDGALLRSLRERGRLPEGFGIGLDERIVELPWTAAFTAEGRWLDAGSSLNHRYMLDAVRPRVDALTIFTARYEGQAYPEHGVGYEFGDLRRLPYRDGWFDGVACISTLEHVGMDNRIYGDPAPPAPDPLAEARAALDELVRVTRPGGTVLLSVPFGRAANFGWFHQLDAAGLGQVLHGREHTADCFRYRPDGWVRCEPEEAADAAYRDAGAEPLPEDGAVSARAVACIRITTG